MTIRKIKDPARSLSGRSGPPGKLKSYQEASRILAPQQNADKVEEEALLVGWRVIKRLILVGKRVYRRDGEFGENHTILYEYPRVSRPDISRRS